MSCAQTAIIPTNSAIDANAAASSTKTFNMPASCYLEHMKNIVPILFLLVKDSYLAGFKNNPCG